MPEGEKLDFGSQAFRSFEDAGDHSTVEAQQAVCLVMHHISYHCTAPIRVYVLILHRSLLIAMLPSNRGCHHVMPCSLAGQNP